MTYWREGNDEVDYVVRRGCRVTTIEVKSGSRGGSGSGLAAIAVRYPIDRRLLVGADGVPVAEFLESPPERWLA